MPTLLQINVTANSGSTGKIAEQIGLIAINKGWESWIAYGRSEYKSKSNLIKIGNRLSMIIHGIQTRLFDRHGLASSIATKKLVKKIKEIKPDVIHIHNIHGYYLNYPILFSFLEQWNGPVVWTFHDCWPMTGHCTHFTTIQCDKWKIGCEKCPLKTLYPKSVFQDRSRKNWILKKEKFTSIKRLTIVSVSKWLNDLVSKSIFKNKSHICIYNGIDIEIFRPRVNSKRKEYGLDDKFILLAVANTWTKSKGLIDYINLSKKLEPDDRIVLIGVPKNLSLNLPHNIIAIPRTENQIELAEWYTTADIVLNLSYQETFGLSSVEGMACGTPSIVYNTTASPELMISSTGFIVEAGDLNGVEAAIKEIKAKSKSFYTIACRKHAEENFDKNKCFNQYIELYNSIRDSDI